jgi:hypothetical protein
MSHSRKPKDERSGASLRGSGSQFPKQLKIVCNSRVFPQREKESSFQDFRESHLQSSSASSSGEKIVDPRQNIFDQEFYNRIDAFLDEEGLFPVDPKDALLGIRQFSKNRLSEESKLSKSQTHSPTRLISCSPIESKLFQRRMSLSLAPSKLIERLCNSQVPKPLDIKMSHLFLQKMKAIEEVDTPALSRTNSECAASTPKRVADSKQISRLLKDLSNESKSRGSSANPLVHSTSAESPELGSKRRRTDELVPLSGSLKLKTASSLILPSENAGRISRRSKFFENGNQQNCDDSFVFPQKKLQNQEEDCPPMA